MKHDAISLIMGEQRSLAAVIDAMTHVVRKTKSAGKSPDFKLLHAMLYYIREFPEQRHHPSEDASLFALLMQRTDEADEVISELEAEHDDGEAMLGKEEGDDFNELFSEIVRMTPAPIGLGDPDS